MGIKTKNGIVGSLNVLICMAAVTEVVLNSTTGGNVRRPRPKPKPKPKD